MGMSKGSIPSILLTLTGSLAVGMAAGAATLVMSGGAGESEPLEYTVSLPPIRQFAVPYGRLQRTEGHGRPLIELSIEPIRTDEGENGEVITYNIRMQSNFAAAGRIVYATELVNEQSEVIVATQISPIVFIQAGAHIAVDFRSPEDLADGRYMLKVTAAGSAGQDEMANIRYTFFEVRVGTIEPITTNEWYSESLAVIGDER